MASDGRKLHPRDEAKELDDKLMELGLLEPGMTLQEKKELALVILESTRMAEEHSSQRNVEEKWESMLYGPGVYDGSHGVQPTELYPASGEAVDGREARFGGNDSAGRDDRGLISYRDALKATNRICLWERRVEESGVENGGLIIHHGTADELTDRKGVEEERKEIESENQRGKANGIDGASAISDHPDASCDKEVDGFSGNVEYLNPRNSHGNGHKNPPHIVPLINPTHGTEEEEYLLKTRDANIEGKEIEESSDRCRSHTGDGCNCDESFVKSGEEEDCELLIEGMDDKIKFSKKHFDTCPILKDWKGGKIPENLEVVGENLCKGLAESHTQECGAVNEMVENTSKPKVTSSCDIRECPVRTVELSLQDEEKKMTTMERETRPRAAFVGEGSGGGEERIESESHVSGRPILGDFIVAGKKKRRMAKGARGKNWNDVVIFGNKPNEESPQESVEVTTKPRRKISQMPNKRWRRVRRKFVSSFGSGSEVDEWISSEEEQNLQEVHVTKEQIIAKFDDQLSHLDNFHKELILSDTSQRNKRRICLLCDCKSETKVPPGFQEPESDDECNLWKICFWKQSPSSHVEKNAIQMQPRSRNAKTDVIPLPFGSLAASSQVKQEPYGRISSSETPSTVKGKVSSSNPAEFISQMNEWPSLSVPPTQSDVSLCEPAVLNNAALMDNAHQRPFSLKKVQTNGKDSSEPTSNIESLVKNGLKSEDGDLHAIPPVAEELKIPPEDGTALNEALEATRVLDSINEPKNEIGPSESVEKSTVEPNGEEKSPQSSPGQNMEQKVLDGVSSLSLSSPGTLKESPPPFHGSSIVRGAWGQGHTLFKQKDSERKAEYDEKTRREAEESENRAQGLASADRRFDDLQELLVCPLCNKEFPISVIEVHASGCGQKDNEHTRGSWNGHLRNRGHHRRARGYRGGHGTPSDGDWKDGHDARDGEGEGGQREELREQEWRGGGVWRGGRQCRHGHRGGRRRARGRFGGPQ